MTERPVDYQRLYEGSQRSLSEMATRQSEALRAHGFLRDQLIMVLKRTWPVQFREAERRANRRMRDLPDDVLLAYLEAFASSPADAVDQLRDALTQRGLSVPVTDDLSMWADHLHQQPATPPEPPPTGDGQHGRLVGLFPPAGPELPHEHDSSGRHGGRLDGLFGSAVQPTDNPPAAAPAAEGDGTRSPQPKRRLPEKIRPEQINAGSKQKRKPRVSAAPPDAAAFDVPPDRDLPVDSVPPQVHDKLMAAATLPQPVFTSDLVSVAGGVEMLAAWERQMRRGELDAPVRFIGAKSRHQARGSLVLPMDQFRDADSEFAKSWWGTCIRNYRGARLYELAVLLNRVGSDVVTHRFGPETAMLRLKQADRIVGVVCVLGASLEPGGDTREAVVGDLEELLADQLTMVAVLGTRNDAVAAEVEQAVVDEAQARGWKPAMPVVAALSWEWADSAGAAARQLLT